MTDPQQNQVISSTLDSGGAVKNMGVLVAQGQTGHEFPMVHPQKSNRQAV